MFCLMRRRIRPAVVRTVSRSSDAAGSQHDFSFRSLREIRCSFASGGGAAEVGRLGQREELLQALVFDLPDPLSGHVERSAHFVQRLRTLAFQSVAEFEYLALAARKAVEDLAESVLAHRDLDLLVGEPQVAVGEEVAELTLVVVTDRLVERDRVLAAVPDLLDLA